MKKTFITGLHVALAFIIGCSKADKDYLEKVLLNLEQIESARYVSTLSSSAPGDTTAFITNHDFVYEFSNPDDTIIGAGYIKMDINDTSKIEYIYDGNMSAFFNWDTKTIETDHFEGIPESMPRPVMPPFFHNVKSIINYALESKDSLVIIQQDYKDSIKFTLKVFNKIVEFCGKPIVFDCSSNPSEGKISQYEIWINKKTNLPYRMRRKLPHQTSSESCSDVVISNISPGHLRAEKYFPATFSFINIRNKKITTTELEGKKAPDWKLQDLNEKSISLKNFDRKVLLLQFTGVGCGPCHASIPFLRQLVIDNENKGFEFICIESWSTNIEGMKRYSEKNEFNFKFLVANEELIKNYNIMTVPTFFVIDKERIIQKVIIGYKIGDTDKEIKEAIKNIL